MRVNRILTGFLLLVAVLMTMPWIDGFLFKRNYYHFLKTLAASHSIDVTILAYHQGWFHSTAKLSMTFKANKTEIILNQAISHGPLVWDKPDHHWTIALASVRSQMHLPASLEVFLSGSLHEDGILESYAIATLDGHYRVQFQTPAFAIQLPGGMNIFWQGLNGKMVFYRNGLQLQKVTADVLIGAATVTEQSVTLPFRLNPSHINLSFANVNMQSLLKWVVTPATQIEEQVILNTSSGTALLDAEVTWPVAVKTVKGIIRGAHGTANVRIAMTLVDQLLDFADDHDTVNNVSLADQLRDELKRLEKKGMITRDNADYRVSMTLERGVVKANGREVQRLM